jgi:hypothetical protein
MTLQWLEPLLKSARYGRLDELNSVSHKDKDQQVMQIVQSCVRFTDCAFFYDNNFFYLSPFGFKLSNYSLFMNDKSCLPSNFLASNLQMDVKSLRTLFTGIEFLLYKAIQLRLEENPYKYSIESEKASARFSRLRNQGQLKNVDENEFNEIMKTRNAFAHSFVDIEEIEYSKSELEYCFESSRFEHLATKFNLDRKARPTRFFKSDATALTNELIREHQEVQMNQIDGQKLNSLLAGFLRKHGD